MQTDETMALEPEAQRAELDPLAPPPKRLGIFDERLSPILVKEVRQALRGRLFKVSFWFTLVAATLIGVSIIVNMSGVRGEEALSVAFFGFIHACMIIAVVGVVPFSAFLSMGAEWDENTFDLLVLSNLKPRQIILGKLLSAGVQGALFFSAFGPFLVFAFLLRGIDLVAVSAILAFAALLSATASTVAISISSLTTTAFVRRMLILLLAILLGGTCMSAIGMGGMFIARPQELRDPDTIAGLSGIAISMLVLLSFSFAIACSRLAHEEENRSTGLRVLSTLALGVLLGWLGFMYPKYFDLEVVFGVCCFGAFFAFCNGLFFCSEAEELGRRTRRQIPRNPLLSQLAVPFLPGGGRGMLLLLLQLSLLGGGALGLWWFKQPSTGRDPIDEGLLGFLTFALYVALYLGVPCAILSRISGDLRGRSVIRGSVLLLFVVATFLPSILGFFVGDRSLMEFEHPGHPFWIIDQVWNGNPSPSESALLVAVLVVTGAALALNLPRMARGWHEVGSTRRRLAESAEAPAGAAVDELERSA